MISFSEEIKEKVGLLSRQRRVQREKERERKRELEELTKIAKDILIQQRQHEIETQKIQKLALRDSKMAEKEKIQVRDNFTPYLSVFFYAFLSFLHEF